MLVQSSNWTLEVLFPQLQSRFFSSQSVLVREPDHQTLPSCLWLLSWPTGLLPSEPSCGFLTPHLLSSLFPPKFVLHVPALPHYIANALPILSSLLHNGLTTSHHLLLLPPRTVAPLLHGVGFVILCRSPALPSALLIICATLC